MPENRGRPSIYSQELADDICKRLASGESLRKICKDDDKPDEATVRKWALDNKNGFFPQYEESRMLGYMAMAEEILDISDDSAADKIETEDGKAVTNGEVVARSRLRVDTRKWLLSKVLPKMFGDKLALEHSEDPEAPVGMTALDKLKGAINAKAETIKPDNETNEG